MDATTRVKKMRCFGSVLSCAYTPEEIAYFFSGVVPFVQTMDTLTSDVDEVLWHDRRVRLAVSEEKWRRAVRAAHVLRFIPWMRMIAVCNTVAMGLARPSSDIDLFLVAAAGHVWSVRFFSHLLLALFGMRRHGDAIENQVCLSFSVSDAALDLSPITKQPRDPYLAMWGYTLVPVFNTQKTYEQFCAVNSWMHREFEGGMWHGVAPSEQQFVPRWVPWIEKVVPTFLWRWVESLTRWYQRRRIYAHPTSRVHDASTDVIAHDDMLKFHEEDRREEIAAQWTARCGAQSIAIENL